MSASNHRKPMHLATNSIRSEEITVFGKNLKQISLVPACNMVTHLSTSIDSQSHMKKGMFEKHSEPQHFRFLSSSPDIEYLAWGRTKSNVRGKNTLLICFDFWIVFSVFGASMLSPISSHLIGLGTLNGANIWGIFKRFASCTGLLACGSLFTQLTWRVTELIRLSQLLYLQKDLLKPQKNLSSLDLHSTRSIPCPPITMTFSALPSGSYQVDKFDPNADFDFCKSKCPTGWDAFDAIF